MSPIDVFTAQVLFYLYGVDRVIATFISLGVACVVPLLVFWFLRNQGRDS